MRAAEHGADFPMARKVRSTMSMKSLHDFAAGPTLPAREDRKESKRHEQGESKGKERKEQRGRG